MHMPVSRANARFALFAIACAAALAAACGGGGGAAMAPPISHGVNPSPSPQQSASPSPTPSSSPSPSPNPSPTETPPAQSAYIDDTWTGIHVFQPFDNFDNKYIIPPSQAAADGPRYNAVWGSNSGQMVAAWKTNNATIRTSYYLPLGTDALTDQFGDLGHGIDWWQQNHPDWVLYECDKTTIAYVGGIPEVPLDISNQSVVQYLDDLAGGYAEANGYAAVGVDFAEVNNPTGGGGGGSRGCGVWTQNHTVWVQKFSGQQVDPAYAAAVLNYLATFRHSLHGMQRPLALWGNNVPGTKNYGDATEQQVIGDLDIVEDESGDARYGHYADNVYFNNRVRWARYIQGLGKGYMPTGLWHETQLTNAEIEYAIASYLMSKEQASALTADPYGYYGQEHYYPAYQAAVGRPCAEMYKPVATDDVYFRKYSGALAVQSTSGSQTYTVSLPQASYTDAVTGQTVTSPVQVTPFDGLVLLTPNGCR